MNNKIQKQNKLRLLIQCISFAFHNGYARGWLTGTIYTGDNKSFCVPGLNCYSCPGALGACPIGSLQAVMDSGKYEYKISLYIFGFIGAVGVLCGRFICGWLCPFGLVQDLLHKIPFPKKVKNLPGHQVLKYLRYVILILFVIILPVTILGPTGGGQPWFCEWICPSGTLFGGIPLVIANGNLRSAIGFRFFWKLALLILVIVTSIISYRPFCKYVCPLGALYGLANPISLYRLKVNEEKCVQCGTCQKVCGMDIKTWQKPNSTECIRCGKCMTACPTGAITSTLSERLPKKTDVKPVDEIKPTTNPSKVKPIIAGILCILNCILPIVLMLSPIQSFLSQGVETSVSFLNAYSGHFFALIYVLAVLCFGIQIFKALNHPEQLEALYSWPKKILITFLVVLFVGFLLFNITVYFSIGGITLEVLEYGLFMSLSYVQNYIIFTFFPLIGMIIVAILMRKPKIKQ